MVLLVSAWMVLLASRSYRASHDLFGGSAVSDSLRHPERTGVAGLQEVSFTAADGTRLSAWYAPSRNRAAIVVTHGTNADRTTMLPELRLLSDAGFGVLAFDWPGLGLSGGDILWGSGAAHALTASLDWLAQRSEVDATKLGGLGFSMGGFIMARVAATEPRLRAVVLEGTPTNFDDYIGYHNAQWGRLTRWPAYWALRDSGLLTLASAEHSVGAISPRPVLFITGTLDTEVPAPLVERLYAAAAEPKFLWDLRGAGHGGYVKIAPLEYPRRLVSFFSDALLVGRTPQQ